MSRFEQIKDPSGEPKLEALYREILDQGFGTQTPIAWFTAQSRRPDILETTWGLVKGLLLQGELPPTLKQMIILRISTDNDCGYCRVIHTNALKAMGVPAEVIDSLTTDVSPAKLPPTQRAIVEFAARVAKDPKSISDGDFEILRQFEISSGEIMEATMIAAFANFINTWADVSGVLSERQEERA